MFSSACLRYNLSLVFQTLDKTDLLTNKRSVWFLTKATVCKNAAEVFLANLNATGNISRTIVAVKPTPASTRTLPARPTCLAILTTAGMKNPS